MSGRWAGLRGWNFSPTARLLLAVVAVGGVGTLIAVVVLLNASLSVIAAKADHIEVQRANELVHASIESTLKHMSVMATDNSVWDEPVERLYHPHIDATWAYQNWGIASEDDQPYDGTFVLDEDFHVLWGYFRGEPYTGADAAFLGSGFTSLVDRHRPDLNSGETAVSGLSQTRMGLAIVSIGLVRPYAAPLRGHGEMRRYLVMTRHLTPRLIEDMGATFRLNGLRLTPVGDTSRPYFALLDADNRVVGHFTWTPKDAGKLTTSAATPKIRQITWLVCGLVFGFILICGYGLQKLARSESDAQSFALTDGLSGLPNRRALFECLQKAGRSHGAVRKTVVFLDLDGFKDVNDIYGHSTGDKLIMVAAAALKQYLPQGAMLARMGGDEFAMLIGGRDGPARGQVFAEQALAFLTAPIKLGERTVQIGASIGIASGDLKTCRSHELFRRADMAMYHSKANGKGRITHYDAVLDAARLHKQAIEKGIRDGLERDEFDVVYQPIVETRSHQVSSVEALVRWPRRPQGALMPDAFIDIAEASGLIHQLGQYVLKKACRDIGPVPGLRLSVNISPAQFRDPDFERKVADALRETAFPVERLELEVTEGYLVESPDRAVAAIANLKALGVSMALDDFGTGYSSIGYLRRFDFDRIKIDKSLAGSVDSDPQAAALVAGTVGIANALSLAVTAEGVETWEQARLLKLAGCHNLQGYYFSKPKPLAEVLTFIAEAARPDSLVSQAG